MARSVEVLEAEALQLVAADRAWLLERLIASLDPDPELEQAWMAEADRREAEIASGEAEWLAGDEVIARLRNNLV